MEISVALLITDWMEFHFKFVAPFVEGSESSCEISHIQTVGMLFLQSK